MKRILLPLILLVLGLGGGVATAMFLLPAPDPELASGGLESEPGAAPCGPGTEAAPAEAHSDAGQDDHAAADGHEPAGTTEYARLNSQFLIPLVQGSEVRGMIVLTLGLEVAAGGTEVALDHEPRLRDRFLQVLFDHANTGGFDGVFTSTSNMRALRNSLKAAAREVLGSSVVDVLVLDIVRQDV